MTKGPPPISLPQGPHHSKSTPDVSHVCTTASNIVTYMESIYRLKTFNNTNINITKKPKQSLKNKSI